MWIILCEMWINMASLKCIIWDSRNPAKEEINWMSDEHTQSVTHASINRGDKSNERLNSLKAERVILTSLSRK